MIAVISEDDAEYVSPVFAIKKAGWLSEVLAFDRERRHIRRIKMWRPRRKVFIVDWEEFDCKKCGWEGCGRILHDKKLWKAARSGKGADIEDFPQLKAYSKEIILPEWFEVKDDRDIQSLMNVSFGFHDSIPVRIDADESDIQIQFDTAWGCTVTVKFQGVRASALVDRVGVVYDCVLEKTDGGYIWKATCFDWGKAGGTVCPPPVQGEPYIVCDKIKWSIKTGKSGYCAKTKEYTGLFDFYLDLKGLSESVFLKNDRLVLRHGNDTLIIEEGGKGYIIYLNGKRQEGEWEEQDAYDCAEGFLTQINPEDIEEEILADVRSVKPLYVWHYIKYALLICALLSAIGLLLVFFAGMRLAAYIIFFATVPLFVLIYMSVFLIKGKEKRYIVTPTTIYYFNGNISNISLNISHIRDIKLYRSLIKRGVGTIKIKQKGGITFGYGLVAVNGAEKVYNLIRQSIAP